MVGGTIPPQSDSGEISRVLVLNLLWQSKRCSRTAQDISVLTTPSLLSITHGFGPWALDVRGDFAGILGLKWVPPDMPFAPAVELLYRLIPRFWGQGFATDGSLAALEFGFCELQLDTVVAFAVEANTGSRRVMEKVGMVYGSDFDHPSIPELSPLRWHVLYSLKRDNWHEKSSPIRILV